MGRSSEGVFESPGDLEEVVIQWCTVAADDRRKEVISS
jgi:hypothetical protein